MKEDEKMQKNMQLPQLDHSQLVEEEMYLIDVRSPKEFNEFHIPSSINIPILSNEEREEVGKMYKKIGPERAKERGIEIFSKKLPTFYQQWKDLEKMSPPDKQFVIICARGRMRSRVVVSTMCSLGLHAYQLIGGIHSVRHHVQEKLEEFARIDWRGIVLSGNTGTGKTYWLQKLMEKGYPIIDLEGLAGHRGSIFGHIGRVHRTQKQFEYELIQVLEKYKDNKLLIFEAESRRIGRVLVPEFLIKLMEKSEVIELSDSLSNRISRIEKDYQPHLHHDQLLEAFHIIRKRISPLYQEMIHDAFLTKNYRQAFSLLLQHYYDPRYSHSTFHLKKAKNDLDLQHLSEEEVLSTLENWIEKLS